jgi:hypothetical protein
MGFIAAAVCAGRFLRETPGNDVGYLAVSSTYRF